MGATLGIGRRTLGAAAIVALLVLAVRAQDAERTPTGLRVEVVACEGQALPGAAVEVRRLDVGGFERGAWAPLSVPPDRFADAGDDGVVVMRDVPDGAWHVRVAAPGRASLERSVRVSAGRERRLTFALPRGADLRGSVVWRDRLVPGAVVIAGPVGFEGDADAELARAAADDRGRFELTGLPPGPVDVWTAMPDRRPGWSLRLDPAGFDAVDVPYAGGDALPAPEADPPGDRRTLRGRVVTPDGEPVADARLGRKDRDTWTLSAEDGTFELELSTGTTWLEARAAGHEPARLRLGEAAEVTVTLEPRPLVRVRVVDPDGEPVAGARVLLGDVERYQQRAWFHTTPGPAVPKAAFTGADGRVSMRRPDADWEMPCAVTAPGFGRVEIELPARAPDDERVVTLAPERPIEVRVLGDDAPLAGAWLRLEPAGEPGVPTISAVAADAQRGPVWIAQTDAEGRAVVRGLSGGAVRVVASAPGHHARGVDVDVSAPPAPSVVIDLAAHRELAGRFVWEDGSPVPEATFTVFWVDHPPDWPCYFGPWGPAEDGSFRIPGLREGTYEIILQRWGEAAYAPAVHGPFRVPRTDLRIVVRPPRTITGRVVREDGTPVAGATVEVSADARFGSDVSASATSGDDGAFRVEGAPHGTVHVRMYDEAWGADGRGKRAETWEPRDPGDGALDLVVPRGLTIAGRVLDADGEPVADLLVTAVPVGDDDRWGQHNAACTDAEGRFAIDGLAPGRYGLWKVPDRMWWGTFKGPRPRRLDGEDGTEAGATGVRCTSR